MNPDMGIGSRGVERWPVLWRVLLAAVFVHVLDILSKEGFGHVARLILAYVPAGMHGLVGSFVTSVSGFFSQGLVFTLLLVDRRNRVEFLTWHLGASVALIVILQFLYMAPTRLVAGGLFAPVWVVWYLLYGALFGYAWARGQSAAHKTFEAAGLIMVISFAIAVLWSFVMGPGFTIENQWSAQATRFISAITYATLVGWLLKCGRNRVFNPIVAAR